MAMGARTEDLVELVLRRGIRLAGISIGCGVLLAYSLTPLMRNMLFGVDARNPWVFVGLAFFAGAVALAAAWVPAHRATRTMPTEVLRHE
jgi:ABC-type lipoprotein release transport system permease subunit